MARQIVLLTIGSVFCILLYGQDGFPSLADSLWERESYAEATQVYEAGLKNSLDRKAYSRYLQGLIQYAANCQSAGEYDRAARLFERYLALLPPALPRRQDSLLALAYHKLGVVHYYRDDYRSAARAYQRSLRIRARSFPADHPDLLKTLGNLGTVYYFNDQIDSAIYCMQQVLQTYQSAQDPPRDKLAALHQSLANAYADLEDKKNCQLHLQAAVALRENLGDDDPAALTALYLDASRCAWLLKDAAATIDFAQKAIRRLEGAAEGQRQRADALNFLAIGYKESQRGEASERAYREALQAYRQVEGAQRQEGYIHFNLAALYYTLKQPAQALAEGERAIAVFLALADTANLASGMHARGVYLNELGRRQEALRSFERAEQLLFTGQKQFPPPPALVADHQRGDLIELYVDKAVVLAAAGAPQEDIKKALGLLDFSLAQLELLRLDVNADESKRFISEKARPVFNKAISLHLRLWRQTRLPYYAETAFQLAERARAFTLLSAIQQRRLLATAAGAWREQEYDLRRGIVELEQRLRREDHPDLRRQLADTNFRLQQLMDSVRRAEPHYRDAATQTTASVTDIQALLRQSGRALIEYVLTEEEVHLFYLDGRQLQVATIALDFPLQEWVTQLRQTLTQGAYADFSLLAPDEQARYDEQYRTLAYQLYRKLLAPIAEQYALPEALVLIPDGVLAYIPFAALLTAPSRSAAYRELPYLLRQHALSFSYSATYLHSLSKTPPPPTNHRLLAFAPSFTNHQAATVRANERSGLLPLGFNRAEVAAIARLIPTDTYYAQQATKENFLRAATDYHGLHLSSHALVDADNPDFSYIAFSQQSDTVDEGQLLFVNDLYLQYLQAELAVLSACETSMGEIIPGEGIISLARAFAYAGVRSTLTTLWKVNDEATQEAVIAFYQALHAGQTKDMALQAAQLAMIDKQTYAHPYYWSGLVLYGATTPMEFRAGGWQPWALGGLLLLAGWGWWRRGRKKQEKAGYSADKGRQRQVIH